MNGTAGEVNGGNALYTGDVALNVPLYQDKLAARVVGWAESGGGFIDQPIGAFPGKNVNDVHITGVRAPFLWAPTERLSVSGVGELPEDEGRRLPGLDGMDRPISTLPEGRDRGRIRRYVNQSNVREPFEQDYTLYTLSAKYDLGFGTVTATSTRGLRHELQAYDTSGSSCAFGNCTTRAGYRPPVWTTEVGLQQHHQRAEVLLRLPGAFQLVAGAFAQTDSADYETGSITANPANGVLPCYTLAECRTLGDMAAGVGASVVRSGTAQTGQDRPVRGLRPGRLQDPRHPDGHRRRAPVLGAAEEHHDDHAAVVGHNAGVLTTPYVSPPTRPTSRRPHITSRCFGRPTRI